MRAALLLVDLITTFEHEDGDRLLASYRDRVDGMRRALADARARELPVIYANDDHGLWDGNGPGLVRRALAGRGGDLVAAVAPRDGDRLLLKPRYSAFDHTPLVLILGELDVELLLLGGTATERCVVQTAIDARELGFKVTVLREACAGVSERHERLAWEYLEEIVGARLAEAVPDEAEKPNL